MFSTESFFLHASFEIIRVLQSECVKKQLNKIARVLVLIRAFFARRGDRSFLQFLRVHRQRLREPARGGDRSSRYVRTYVRPRFARPACGFISTSPALEQSPCLNRTNIQTRKLQKGRHRGWNRRVSQRVSNRRFRARAILAERERKSCVWRYAHRGAGPRESIARTCICPDKGSRCRLIL